MLKLDFRVIPEGVTYDESDTSREGVFDTLDEAVGFLSFLAARADEESGTSIGSLLYGSVAQKIVNGDRYGHHRITLGNFVPLIVEWSLEDDGRRAFGRIVPVN